MDVLSDAFSVLRLKGELYFHAAISGAWAIAVPADKQKARLHLVLHGDCFARLSMQTDPIRLRPGDMLIVCGGASHFLADRVGRTPLPLDAVLAQNPPDAHGRLVLEGDGAHHVRLLCGICDFDASLGHPALSTLPETFLLRSNEIGSEPWMSTVLRAMAMEAERGGLGMNAVLTRLLEIVFVQAIRSQRTTPRDSRPDFMHALSDPKVSQALQVIHADPAANWNLTRLAREIGVSRSVLSDRFAKAVGEPPMTYLRRWRLFRARQLLQESGLSVPDVAQACGYASVPSFTRRFSTAFGMGPGHYRKSRRN